MTNKDHPRLCGEKVEKKGIRESRAGSPPPMRGKVTCSYFVHNGGEDHPRLCGEKGGFFCKSLVYEGSPPPMRGKGLVGRDPCVNHRITPAYAGKSTAGTSPRCRFWDHPRLCGEKFRIPRIAASQLGSPPPMRGKDFGSGFVEIQAGITPAYAGKSSVADRTFTPQRDHPRLCGEKLETCKITRC